ncbi:MAG: polysaccharide pyruvyl transferase family protein [Comamonadaceae bacterium]|nr:polysaccharide pyruvyl transferase family protein [Comamonadaceae bacterium]
MIEAIRSCDLLLTETMHGAIVADLYRVPWVAVTCTDIVHSLKWRDWLSSLRLALRAGRDHAAVRRVARHGRAGRGPPARRSGICGVSASGARTGASRRRPVRRQPMCAAQSTRCVARAGRARCSVTRSCWTRTSRATPNCSGPGGGACSQPGRATLAEPIAG